MTPAFAVMEELRARGYHNFEWVGHEYSQSTTKSKSAEYKIITSQGIPFHRLEAGKFMWVITRHNWRTVLRDWFRFPWGFVRARRILKAIKPDVVISFGGYLALPIVHQAKAMGIASVTHEQTVVLGRANRWIGKLADKVLVSWESSLNSFPGKTPILTGNPIRKAVFEVRSDNYHFPDNDLPILFITGGNQGSYNMSRRIFRVLPELLEQFNIIHQTGDSTDRETFAKALFIRDHLPFELRNRYIPQKFIYDDEWGEVMHKADIIFARSGANTVMEVAALGKLALFMPINWSSGGEQRRNALVMEETGLGKICKQTDAEDEPWRVMRFLLEAKQVWFKGQGFDGRDIDDCRRDAFKLVHLDAASKIVAEIEELIALPHELPTQTEDSPELHTDLAVDQPVSQ